MCAPRVTRHTSIQYSSSCHTRVSMGASIFFAAAMIRAFRSERSRGNGILRTLHEMHVAQKPQTYSCDIPTHKTTSPLERPFSHYINSHRLAAEMWTTMKNNLLEKKNWVFPSICIRGVLLTTHPLLVPRSWKSRAIPLPTLWFLLGL